MDANEIRKALFPHEETIKRLETENKELKAKVAELEALVVFETVAEAAKGKGRKRGGDTGKES